MLKLYRVTMTAGPDTFSELFFAASEFDAIMAAEMRYSAKATHVRHMA